MKRMTSFNLSLAAAALITFGSVSIVAAAAGTDTCAGINATIGGTCTPLTNTISGNNDNTAFPQGRVGLPQDAASFVAFLCSQGAGWITGQIIDCDGGWSTLLSD